MNKADLPLTRIFIDTPGTALLFDLRGIGFPGYVFEELPIRVSARKQKSFAPRVFYNDGAGLEQLEPDRAALSLCGSPSRLVTI